MSVGVRIRFGLILTLAVLALLVYGVARGTTTNVTYAYDYDEQASSALRSAGTPTAEDRPVEGPVDPPSVTFRYGYDLAPHLARRNAGLAKPGFAPRAAARAAAARAATRAPRGVTGVVDDLGVLCRTNIFVPATLVLMADGTTNRIADIQVGDMVMAAAPETGERGPRRVTDTIVGDGIKELVDIGIDGNVITATDRHPFRVDDEGGWVDAEDLEGGDVLLLADGDTATVDTVRERTEVRRVHNLTVDGIHTYYVLAGDDPVLVHNCRSLDDLSRAAAAPDRNGLTAAGRAAQKHGTRPGSSFPLSPDRTARGYNEFGQDLVDDLLTAPNTATRTYAHPSHGRVTEYLGPQYGGRWGPNGEFLGFL